MIGAPIDIIINNVLLCLVGAIVAQDFQGSRSSFLNLYDASHDCTVTKRLCDRATPGVCSY